MTAMLFANRRIPPADALPHGPLAPFDLVADGTFFARLPVWPPQAAPGMRYPAGLASE